MVDTSVVRARIPGLDELRRDLARAAKDVPRPGSKVYAAAARTIARRAAAVALAEGSVAAKSAADIRARRSSVLFGGKGYDLGAEYGSKRYKQFKAWRGNGENAGYFVWPTVREYANKRASLDIWNELYKTLKKRGR